VPKERGRREGGGAAGLVAPQWGESGRGRGGGLRMRAHDVKAE